MGLFFGKKRRKDSTKWIVLNISLSDKHKHHDTDLRINM